MGWLDLLLVPAVLSIGGLLFSRAEKRYELQIQEQRSKVEREIAEDGLQEATLDSYFHTMSEVILDKKLSDSKPSDEIRAVARAQTLTALRRLDRDRKRHLLQFLNDIGLIVAKDSIIHLGGADLDGANLNGAELLFVDLQLVKLRNANMAGAKLHNSDLGGTDLTGSDLTGAELAYCWLGENSIDYGDERMCNLSGANLSGADLTEADLSDANLEGAILYGAFYTTGTKWPENFDPVIAGAILDNSRWHDTRTRYAQMYTLHG